MFYYVGLHIEGAVGYTVTSDICCMVNVTGRLQLGIISKNVVIFTLDTSVYIMSWLQILESGIYCDWKSVAIKTMSKYNI